MRLKYTQLLKICLFFITCQVCVSLYRYIFEGSRDITIPTLVNYDISKDGIPIVLNQDGLNASETDKVIGAHMRYYNINSIDAVKKRLGFLKSVPYSLIGEQRKDKVYMSVGLPSVKEQTGPTYLMDTLASIINTTSPQDQSQITVIIFLTSADTEYNVKVTGIIKDSYLLYLESGFIVIVKISDIYYRKVLNVGPDYKIVSDVKNVLDIAFLVQFSQNFSRYYLQLEDGVKCAPGFYKTIHRFIQQQPATNWTVLEFSNNDFMGKLYNSSDLHKYSVLLTTFHSEQPIGALTEYFQQSMAQKNRIKYIKSLFHYTGKNSSYASDWESQKLISSQSNPPAYVFSTLKALPTLEIANAYKEKGYAWVIDTAVGDTITIVFEKPDKFKTITVKTGAVGKVKDILRSGTISVCTRISSFSVTNKELFCADSRVVGNFVAGRCDVTLTNDLLINAVIITVTGPQPNWVAVDHIKISKS